MLWNNFSSSACAHEVVGAMILTILAISILIAAALFGIPTAIFLHDMRQDHKKSKQHQPEIDRVFQIGP